MSVNTNTRVSRSSKHHITYFGVNFPAVYPDSDRKNATRNERFLRDAILKRHSDINELFRRGRRSWKVANSGSGCPETVLDYSCRVRLKILIMPSLVQ